MYVFEIPFLNQKQLCDVLDSDSSWENLAARMGLSTADVVACRSSSTRGHSPAAEVLRIWGSKATTVNQLYKMLARLPNRRAMLALHDIVDAKYHKLLDCAAVGSGGERVQQSDVAAAVSSAASAQCSSCAPVSSFSADSVASACRRRARGSSANDAVLAGLQNTLVVAYAELRAATDDFAPAHELGRGGYGVVYRGYWKHTPVAVKRVLCRPRAADATHASQQDRERIRQSLMELKALALYRHDNILPLYGYSFEGAEPCLVYQLMAGGSLEDRLRCRQGSAPLTWLQRRAVATGGARGLHFLHTISAQPLIHGDVKSANILLNAHFEPKLGDFGLSRMGQLDMGDSTPPLVASHVKGTLAYLPPEFVRSKHLSAKLDVYSFGVVLYELATGLRAYADNRKPENLVDFMNASFWKAGKVDVDDMADSGASGDSTFTLFTDLAVKCCDASANSRPAMGHILSALEGH